MKLIVTCQLCGQILSVIQKDSDFSADDINMYEQACFCDTVQDDGVTIDGQTSIQVTKTVS